jgi:hypothetical protein
MSYKVITKRMTKTKKSYKQPWRGSYIVIARKVGCTPKYVSMVLRDKLGDYNGRDTKLVKQIRKVNREVEALFEA